MNHSVSFTSQDSDQGPVPRPGYCDNGNVWGGPGNSGNSRPASTRHQPPPGTHNGLCIWTLITLSTASTATSDLTISQSHIYWRLQQSHNAMMRRAIV